jgi:hypothetical protein
MTTYMASPVPRNIRQTKLGHLSLNCVIGTRSTKIDNGSWHVLDIIMLPVPLFHRMKLHAGLQHALTPTPSPGGSAVGSGYVLTNIEKVTVPATEDDPELFAKLHFLKVFNADPA